MLLNPRKSSKKAFTLLELIVVIVILGLLAALAIPTFARVTKRSQDASTATTLAAVLRDARALMAFQDGTTWEQALSSATQETAAPSASGLLAASYAAPVTAGTLVAGQALFEPSSTQPVYAFDSDQGLVVLSLRSKSGSVCVGSTTLTNATSPTCAPALTGASSAQAVVNGDVLGDGSTSVLPPGTAPAGVKAPGPATAVTAVASPGQVVVTWTAPAGDAKSAPTSYEVTPSTTGVPVVVTSSAGALPTTLTFTDLAPGTPVSFTVKALNSKGSSTSTASSTVTPYAAPLAPASVTATATTSKTARVTWSASTARGAAVSGYRVRATPASGSPVVTVNVGASTTQADLANLLASTAYSVTVTPTTASAGDGAPGAAAMTTPAAPVLSGGTAGYASCNGNNCSSPTSTFYFTLSSPSAVRVTSTVSSGAYLQTYINGSYAPVFSSSSYTSAVLPAGTHKFEFFAGANPGTYGATGNVTLSLP